MIVSPIIDPYAIHSDSFVGDVYTIDTASITLTAGTLTAEQLTSTDDITMQGHLLTMGNASAATDTVMSFLGSTNSGSITFDESADEFDFGDAALTSTGIATVGKFWAKATGTGARFFLDRTDGGIIFLTGGAFGSSIYYDTETHGTAGSLHIYKCAGTNIRDETFTGAAKVWEFGNTGHLLPGADDTYNIGSSSLKVKQIYVAAGAADAPSVAVGDDNTGLWFNTVGGPDRLYLTTGGTTRLAVSSSGTVVDGELKGGRCVFSYGTNLTDQTASMYLKMINGMTCSATVGYVMPRAGSIVGVYAACNVDSSSDPGSLAVEVQKNGSAVFSVAETLDGATGQKQWGEPQARGTDTFAAGDQLQVRIVETGTVQWDYPRATVEVQFDS